MKLTRSSLKELIRQSIDELKEGGKGSGPNKGDRKGMDYTGMSVISMALQGILRW